MTQDEFQLFFDLYMARSAGLVGAVKDEYVPEAHRLAEKGWLERRWFEDDLVWQLTDTALTSLSLAGLNRDSPADQN